jgi:hypothetical protein
MGRIVTDVGRQHKKTAVLLQVLTTVSRRQCVGIRDHVAEWLRMAEFAANSEVELLDRHSELQEMKV